MSTGFYAVSFGIFFGLLEPSRIGALNSPIEEREKRKVLTSVFITQLPCHSFFTLNLISIEKLSFVTT